MINAAVLGSPIAHSLSPVLHRRAYEILGIEGRYQAIEVGSGQLPNFLAEVGGKFDGFSLTMPLKEEAVPLSAVNSPEVEITGALNTLIRGDGDWSGHNTDVLGFEFLIRDYSKASVTILGAGGTARAALLAATRMGSSTRVFRRSSERDTALRQVSPGVEIRDWSEIGDELEAPIIVNATPSGALSQINHLHADLVIDALYHPWPTHLSKVSHSKSFVSGIDLLAAQASFQVNLMTNRKFDIPSFYRELKSAALAAINK